MRVSREQISVALFNLLNQSTALNNLCATITRVPKMWSDVSDAQMPYLLLFKGGPNTEGYTQQQHIGETKYRIHYNLWFYLRSDVTGQTLAETVINNVADAIDAAMQTNSNPAISNFGERQTLGGLVNNAWLEGGSEWAREFQDNTIVVMWLIAVETGI